MNIKNHDKTLLSPVLNVLTCLDRLSWREGQVVCESLGGYLAEIVSQEQQTLVVRSDVQ